MSSLEIVTTMPPMCHALWPPHKAPLCNKLAGNVWRSPVTTLNWSHMGFSFANFDFFLPPLYQHGWSGYPQIWEIHLGISTYLFHHVYVNCNHIYVTYIGLSHIIREHLAITSIDSISNQFSLLTVEISVQINLCFCCQRPMSTCSVCRYLSLFLTILCVFIHYNSVIDLCIGRKYESKWVGSQICYLTRHQATCQSGSLIRYGP